MARVERVGFIEQARQRESLGGMREEGREVVDASLGGLSVFGGHGCDPPH